MKDIGRLSVISEKSPTITRKMKPADALDARRLVVDFENQC
jgi:hypothetical protein